MFFDSRLGMGIPGFYRLITRLVEDMRSYNQIGGSARVTFSVVRNFDASEYLDDVPAEVPGAFYESFHVEETCSESRPADNVQDESKRILESNTGAAAMAYATQIIGDIQPDESSPVLRFIDGACSQKVDAENLIRVVNALGDAFALLASQFAVGMLNEFGDPNDPLGIIEMAFTGITLQLTFNNQVASVFTKLLDAYDVQVNYQTTPEERTMLLDALDQFGKHTFLSADMFPDSLLQQDYVNDIEWLSKEDKACFKRLRADRKSLKQKKPKSSK